LTVEIDIEGARLLERFTQKGFTGLIYDEPMRLSEYLRNRAAGTGRKSLASVADAISNAYSFFLGEDEAGGVRIGFVAELDRLVFDFIPAIRRSSEEESVKLAWEFLSRVQKRVAEYDPRKTYGS